MSEELAKNVEENVEEADGHIEILRMPSKPLFSMLGKSEGGWGDVIRKAFDDKAAEVAGRSNQPENIGEVPHPYNMRATSRFLTANVHHSACIAAKVSATIGLGMESEEDEEVLDKLCDESWQATFNEVWEDYENTGNGYLEVVRKDGVITGLHHLRACDVVIDVEDQEGRDWHYNMASKISTQLRFARFGEADRIAAKYKLTDKNKVSEVIHFSEPTTLSRWYGVPRWLAVVPAVELVIAILQHNYDFFNNRGVPEFMLFFTGGQVDEKTWAKVVKQLKANIGLGNSRKTMAVNIPHEQIKVQLEKLAMEGKEEGSFQDMLDSLSLLVVSGHQTPPLLAGIQIPGKLGANNELPNALMAFQLLTIAPRQKYLRSILRNTLGKDQLGVEGLSKGKDLFKFKTITDEMNLDAMDAVSRTRRPIGAGATPDGQGPQGGKRAPEAGTPAARLQALTKGLGLDGLSKSERVELYVRAISDVMAEVIGAMAA